MAEKRDYYEVLGVDKNADAAALKIWRYIWRSLWRRFWRP